MNFPGDRDIHFEWAESKGAEGWKQYVGIIYAVLMVCHQNSSVR